MSTHIEAVKITDELLTEFFDTLLNPGYSEFIKANWEKFKENKQPKPEWEIIGYNYPPGITDQIDTCVIGPLHYNWNNAVIRDYPIHSVKRLSDGCVWSKGDRFRANAGQDLTIKSFDITVSGIKVWSVEFGYWWLNDLKNVPLFTTEDKVDVYKGAEIAVLSTDNWKVVFPLRAPANPFKGDKDQFKYFSSKEAAMEYVTYNKRCLSLTDVLDASGSDFFIHSINALACNRTKK